MSYVLPVHVVQFYKSGQEKSRRFEIYKANLKIIDERNQNEISNGGTTVHGVTKFSDLSQNEFETQYLGASTTKKGFEQRKSTSNAENKVVKIQNNSLKLSLVSVF